MDDPALANLATLEDLVLGKDARGVRQKYEKLLRWQTLEHDKMQKNYNKLACEMLRVAFTYRQLRSIITGEVELMIHPSTTESFKKHLHAEARLQMRNANHKREQIKEKWGWLTAHEKCSRPVEIARVEAYVAKTAYWGRVIKMLEKMEKNAACKAKIAEAKRMEKQGKQDIREAHSAMLAAGGTEADLTFYWEAEIQNQYTGTFVRSLEERLREWLDEQKKQGERLVSDMVMRVIIAVKSTIVDGEEEEWNTKAQAQLSHSYQASEIMEIPKKEVAKCEVQSPQPEPSVDELERESAALTARARIAALAAVRKTNEEVAKKFARVEAERQRDAKERKAMERYTGRGKRASTSAGTSVAERRPQRVRAQSLVGAGVMI